ncbi:MAG: four helix bundle protein, partial [Verrucomicrobia bacterium]|nr:four helix bundle protein [Verrucomicrobiota bacterium]
FLDLAKGSCGEVRSMSYASEDIGVLSQKTGSQLRAQSEALSQRIAAFSRHLRR